MLTPFKKRVLSDIIAEKIVGYINKKLTPGDQLPSERKLCEMLSVSRTSVREALQILKAYGLIEVKPGDGIFVKGLESSFAKGVINPAYNVQVRELSDLTELRRIIETTAVCLSVMRATNEEKDAMKKNILLMEELVSLNESYLLVDSDFHNLVAKMSKNIFLIAIMEQIRNAMYKSLKHTVPVPGTGEAALKWHKAIYEAIIQKDSEKAKQAMIEHLNVVEDVLNKQLGVPPNMVQITL